MFGVNAHLPRGQRCKHLRNKNWTQFFASLDVIQSLRCRAHIFFNSYFDQNKFLKEVHPAFGKNNTNISQKQQQQQHISWSQHICKTITTTHIFIAAFLQNNINTCLEYEISPKQQHRYLENNITTSTKQYQQHIAWI